MNKNLKWENDNEKIAFERFKLILPSLNLMELKDSHEAVSLLLRKREHNGKWDWGLLEDTVNSIELEFSQQHETYKAGLRLIKKTLHNTFEVKRRKGKEISLLEEPWTMTDTEHLKNTLGVIEDCFKGLEDTRTAILLFGLSLIILYESKGSFARRRISAWASPSGISKEDRNKLVEDYLTINGKGSDNKSDMLHIRNAFAHGHFEFKDDNSLSLWDINTEEKETFRRDFSTQDLAQLTIIFQKKMEMLEIYPFILIALEGLYRTYKREWKTFKR